ncbi:protein CutA homolog isoform X3 [Muntiacus reevesi]|uniref:protein CutA homolog isoform X3 n=1 Tax=Muntiacus reevesi TaxID=9886 RepID=UPI0033079FC9
MSSSFPAPCSLSFRPAWLGPGRQWGGQQVGRGEGAQAFKPTRPPAARPQAAVPMACAGLVTSDAMDRLGSRCPLPGCARPSLLICLLILTASLLTYPVLRTLSLQLLSVVTGSYVSGTYSIVFVNCPNEQIARDIARYYWNGEIEEATEVLLLIKTKTSKIHVLSSYIRSSLQRAESSVEACEVCFPDQDGNQAPALEAQSLSHWTTRKFL